MAKKKIITEMPEYCDCNSTNYGWKCGTCFYFLGFLGTAIYYIQTATGFWGGVVGVLKAIVWPAFIVHKLLGL